jgi:hypothetical protein
MTETRHTPPLFTTGDLIRHRASGERAVVVEALYDSNAAKYRWFSGRYSVSRGFRETVVSVAENEIEKVEETP